MGAVGAVGVVGTSMRTMLKDMKRYNVSIGSNSLPVLNRGMKPVSRDGKTGTRTQDGNVEIIAILVDTDARVSCSEINTDDGAD